MTKCIKCAKSLKDGNTCIFSTEHLLPERRYNPLGSTAKLVTASKCATIECIIFPTNNIAFVVTKNIIINNCPDEVCTGK